MNCPYFFLFVFFYSVLFKRPRVGSRIKQITTLSYASLSVVVIDGSSGVMILFTLSI
jgi:hypothetical protein